MALTIENLSKHFGGVAANQAINLQLDENQIHALIGPNGAGKSTLIAQIAGELKPDSGRIIFNETDITHSPPEQRNQLGLGRLFQTTALFNELSVMDNLRIPLLQKHADGFSPKWFWQNIPADESINQLALSALERLGMEARPHALAGTLSHGEQRQLEMAMTLATEPSCLLLDEPMAGMSNEESFRMTRLIKKLKNDHNILLVEHDMAAVFDLADVISVLVDGKIMASGSVDDIRNSREVQAAYLGTEPC